MHFQQRSQRSDIMSFSMHRIEAHGVRLPFFGFIFFIFNVLLLCHYRCPIFPLLPPSTQPCPPLPQSIPTMLSCPWVLHVCSLTNLIDIDEVNFDSFLYHILTQQFEHPLIIFYFFPFILYLLVDTIVRKSFLITQIYLYRLIQYKLMIFYLIQLKLFNFLISSIQLFYYVLYFLKRFITLQGLEITWHTQECPAKSQIERQNSPWLLLSLGSRMEPKEFKAWQEDKQAAQMVSD